MRSWTPKPLDVGEGPMGEEEPTEADRRATGLASPEVKAGIAQISRAAEEIVRRPLGTG